MPPELLTPSKNPSDVRITAKGESSARDYDDQRFPLARICAAWEAKIRIAREKRQPWKDVSDECLRFYSKSYDFLWDSRVPDQLRLWVGTMAPRFRMTINKAFEFVALYGPAVYARNPVRTVTPRDTVAKVTQDLMAELGLPPELPPPPQPDPVSGQVLQPEPPMFAQMREMLQKTQQRTARGKVQAKLMEIWLNYVMKEGPGGGFKGQMEFAVTEALLKGRGLLWPEPYAPPGSDRVMIASTYSDSYDLYIDADATKLQDAQVVYRECIHPAWQVEREYKLPRGSIPPNYESHDAQAENEGDDLANMHKAQGLTSDLVRYYKVYSKMGVGGRLHDLSGGVKQSLEALGDYCFLVICPGVPYPLNMPTSAMNTSIAEVKKRVAWPVPYWRDNRWPFANLDFYPDPGTPFAIPPLAPGLGELKFMSAMMSHLTNRIWSSCRNLVAVLKGMEDATRAALESGKDLEVVTVPPGLNIDDIRKAVSFVAFPDVQIDVWKILEANAHNFDKRVGLDELMYGNTMNQMRSAQEAAVKEDRISVRPEYMSSKVEDFLSTVARMEALASRWHVESDDVKPIFGEMFAGLWQSHIEGTPVEEVAFEIEYNVEAGSARKQNREQQLSNIQELITSVMPLLAKYAEISTDTKPINAFLEQWADATGKTDMEAIELGPMAPPPSNAPSPEQAKIELEKQKADQQMQLADKQFGLKIEEAKLKAEEAQQKMQMELQKFQMEMDMKRQEHEFEMAATQQQAQVDMHVKQQQAAADVQVAQTQASAQMQTDQAKAQQDMALNKQQSDQQMAQAKAESQLTMQQKKAEGETKLQLAKKQGDVKVQTAKQQSDAKVQATKAQAKAKKAVAPKKKTPRKK